MNLNPIRGAKFGASSALLFPVAVALNNYLKGEKIVVGSLVVGTIFAFLFFGLVGTFTDKVGSDVSD
jgi:hypothetical protein